MSIPDPPFPLAQLTEFEIGETFGVGASVDEYKICCELEDVFIEVDDLNETPLGKSRANVVVAVPLGLDLINYICPSPVDIFHVFHSC